MIRNGMTKTWRTERLVCAAVRRQHLGSLLPELGGSSNLPGLGPAEAPV